ncbi:MAG: hypothetical protein R2754_15675 [Microthrixaceae bacterium]
MSDHDGLEPAESIAELIEQARRSEYLPVKFESCDGVDRRTVCTVYCLDRRIGGPELLSGSLARLVLVVLHILAP